MNGPQPSVAANPRFRDLIQKWCDDRISDSEITDLEAFLRDYPEARDWFAGHTHLNASLESLGPGGLPSITLPGSLTASPTPSPFPSWWAYALAAAVLLALLLPLAFSPNSSSPPRSTSPPPSSDAPGSPSDSPLGFALVTHAIDASWKPGTPALIPGQVLGVENLFLQSGLLHLQLYNGIRLVVEGPASFELNPPDESLLHTGKLYADIPLQAQGFVIQTPFGEVMDYGSTLGVDVRPGQSAEMHVFAGDAVFRKTPQDSGHHLTSGEALSVAPDGTVTPISADASGFASDREVMQWQVLENEHAYSRWIFGSNRWRQDPRLLSYLDFDAIDYLAGLVPSLSPVSTEADQPGIVVGATTTAGRWPAKAGLRFARISDRVRLRVAGQHDALTLVASIRLDRLENRPHALLMSDGSEPGAVHWWIEGQTGAIQLSIGGEGGTGSSYQSQSTVVGPDALGQWIQLASTYDRHQGQVVHYRNGVEIERIPISDDPQVRLGVAELANWADSNLRPGMPHYHFVGAFDEFLIFRTALSPAEIAAIATFGLSQ